MGLPCRGTARKVPLGVAAANLRNGRGHDRDRERVKLASRGCEDEPPARKRSRISAVGRLGLRGVQSVGAPSSALGRTPRHARPASSHRPGTEEASL